MSDIGRYLEYNMVPKFSVSAVV